MCIRDRSKADPNFSVPLTGPRAASFLLTKTAQQGVGGFLGRHHRWARESGAPANDRSIHEHHVLS
eukprot:13940210-Alexandrium_andersonii.AAC.1